MKRSYTFIKQYLKDTSLNKNDQIRFYNFWDTQLPQEMWFARFIQHHKLTSNYSAKINFYSVLGSVETLKYRRKGLNIFFSGENMQAERFSEYKQICEEQPFDLSLGFDYREGENYLRFPLWIMSLFDPRADYQAIKLRVKQLSEIRYDNRTRFCSLVASHDWNEIRAEMMDSLQSIDLVSSGGKFRQNSDELFTTYNDNKYKFIKQFKFNVCPENSNAEGYVTEKIFQSIEAGCIPIYWGADNKPEEDILNQDAIVCWNKGSDNSSIIQLIRELHLDSELYQHFMEQPRLLPNAEDKIWEYYMKLKQNLKDCF